MLFDRIVYNFPHAGFFAKESDDKLIKKHRHLLKMFFQNGVNMLNENGEIHVTHKEGDPYDKWNLVEQAQKCGLILKESVDFNKADYPGYVNRRGAEPNIGDTFFLGKCKTYMFIPRESMGTPSKPTEFSSQGHPEGLGAALLMELETERQNRKAAETAKMELESSLNQLRTVSTKTLIENDELRRQRDEAFQEKTNITRQLAEALRLKEDAEKQKDVTILELAIERKARQDAESAKVNIEGSLNYNKASVNEQLKKMNQLEKQRDDALYQKEAISREKEKIARQLAEALRLKEAAIVEKDRVLRERKDLTNQKGEIVSWTIVVFCGLGIFKLVSSMYTYSRKKKA